MIGMLGPCQITPRPYQRALIDDVDAALETAARGVIGVAPTGSGKGPIQALMVRRAVERGLRCCILVHRRELMRQHSRALTLAGVPHGLIAPDRSPTEAPVHVASVDTLRARLGRPALARFLAGIDLLMIDEVHHLPSASWTRVRKAFSRARCVGWTATPYRLTGEGLGDHFDAQAVGPSGRTLTELGWLAPARIYQPATAINLTKVSKHMGDYAVGELERAVDIDAINAEAVKHWERWCAGRPTLVFTVTVKHAHHVAEAFCRLAKIRAMAIDAGTPELIRDQALNGLADGSVDLVAACQIIAEGIDIPRCAAGVLLRPTMSVSLMQQQIGRVLRPDDTFADAVILDLVGNVREHGMPDEPRPWSLLAGIKAMERRVAKPVRCERCYRVQAAAESCCACGQRFVTPSRPIIAAAARHRLSTALSGVSDDTLTALKPGELIGLCETRADREYVVQLRGFKPGWVFYAEQKKREAPWLFRPRRAG